MAKVYGNTLTDGTGVETALAKSEEYGDFLFRFYVPKDVTELRALIDHDASRIMGYVVDALKTDARGKAWGDARTAAQVKVNVDGKETKTTKAIRDKLTAMEAELNKLRAAAKK